MSVIGLDFGSHSLSIALYYEDKDIVEVKLLVILNVKKIKMESLRLLPTILALEQYPVV